MQAERIAAVWQVVNVVPGGGVDDVVVGVVVGAGLAHCAMPAVVEQTRPGQQPV